MGIDLSLYKSIDPGPRLLLGPGPSPVPNRVMRAMAANCIGHLDPYYLKTMDEVMDLLRFVFQTENEMTLALPGTGSSGMDCTLLNLIEPGDKVVVAVNGFFSGRQEEIAGRAGAEVTVVRGPWGRAIEVDKVGQVIDQVKPKIVAMVHAETSTGVANPVREVAQLAKSAGALMLVDMVTSLGGMDVGLDKIGIDAAYSCSQKGLSCPPGLAPVSFSPAAVEAIKARKSPVNSWYLDMNLLESYWNSERKYHHTAPINNLFGLRESLLMIAEEGLEARFARHILNHRALVAGVEAMGLEMLVPEDERLPMLNTVKIPDGADDLALRKALLNDFNIEIGAGLGDLAGQIWRIGIMGYGARKANVLLVLSAIQAILAGQGVAIKDGAIQAAEAVYKNG